LLIDLFVGNPWKYAPQWGGFCTYGVAFELGAADGSDDAWPWSAVHLGPPCGTDDGWSVINGRLYCNIWDAYRRQFELDYANYTRAAEARWTRWFGSLRAGPFNTRCFGAGVDRDWCIERAQFEGCRLVVRAQNHTLTTTTPTTTTTANGGNTHQSSVTDNNSKPHSRDISGSTLAVVLVVAFLIAGSVVVVTFKYYRSRATNSVNYA
jgi:hypothetical protein